MRAFAVLLFCLSSLNLFAANGSKGAKSPMVIAIIEEAHSDHIVVMTRDKFKRKLILNEQSKVNYIGFDDAQKEIKAGFCITKLSRKSFFIITPSVLEFY